MQRGTKVADFLATVVAKVAVMLLEAFARWLVRSVFKASYGPAGESALALV
jgi:hypothetical protein